MPFSTTYTRTKIFSNAGSLLPADLNSIQDDLGNQLALSNVMSGVNEGGNVRRGKSIIAAAGTRTNATYGALSNGPDQVGGIVLPADGLIIVGFQAVWQESVLSAARAAIFLGANQLVTAQPSGASGPAAQEVQLGQINVDKPISSSPIGLYTQVSSNGSYTGDVTTGQIVGVAASNTGTGGMCFIQAAAGTYTVGVQFKASSGTVTVKNRKLWVRTESYG